MAIPIPVHATPGTGTTTPAATTATIVASGPASTNTMNQPLVVGIGAAFVLICLSVIGLSLYLSDKVDGVKKSTSTLSLLSWNSNQQGTPQQEITWEHAPDGTDTVTLYPGQWSRTLELPFEHSWNIHYDSDITLILNGNSPVSLSRDQDMPFNDNVHTVQVRNDGHVKITYVVTYGGAYQTPKYYYQGQPQKPTQQKRYAAPLQNSQRYYRQPTRPRY